MHELEYERAMTTGCRLSGGNHSSPPSPPSPAMPRRSGESTTGRSSMFRQMTAVAIGLGTLLAAGPEASAQVKIGAVLSVTGPASFLGDPEKKTLEMYVAEINEKGGVNGQKLQLVIYDDGGDANNARTFATRLVEEDKVIAMIGGTTTGSTLAMIPVFEDAQLPFISLAGAVQIIQPVRKWVFKTPHTDTMACEKIFADIKRRYLSEVALNSGSGGIEKSMEAV